MKRAAKLCRFRPEEIPCNGDDRVGHIQRAGWIPDLIRHDGDMLPLGGKAKHRLQKICAERTIYPRRPQNRRVTILRKHGDLAR
jgi:hypothetical protein